MAGDGAAWFDAMNGRRGRRDGEPGPVMMDQEMHVLCIAGLETSRMEPA